MPKTDEILCGYDRFMMTCSCFHWHTVHGKVVDRPFFVPFSDLLENSCIPATLDSPWIVNRGWSSELHLTTLRPLTVLGAFSPCIFCLSRWKRAVAAPFNAVRAANCDYDSQTEALMLS